MCIGSIVKNNGFSHMVYRQRIKWNSTQEFMKNVKVIYESFSALPWDKKETNDKKVLRPIFMKKWYFLYARARFQAASFYKGGGNLALRFENWGITFKVKISSVKLRQLRETLAKADYFTFCTFIYSRFMLSLLYDLFCVAKPTS